MGRLTEDQNRARENNRLKKKYGITILEYEALYEEQQGLCASCGDPMWGKPHLDHDHATGNLREMLCRGCNVALGMLQDKPEKILRLHSYLVKHL